MKKKVLIIIGAIIILLLIIYGIIFFIDYNNVSNGKLPVFAIKSDTENYHGLGYNVNVKYYKDTNNIEKIDMSAFGKTIADTLTKTGSTIIISDISEQENTYGEWFRIDKKTNGFWEELKPIDDNYVFTDIAYKIGENHQLEMNTDWSKLYGELEPGEYRLVKEIYDNGHTYLAVEFTIE